MSAHGADVVIVGGGVIGLSLARRARADGATVTLLDADPGSGASGIAAGMLAPVTEAHHGEETLLRLNLSASRMYPQWVAALEEETGLSTGYRRSGTVLVARDRDDNEALSELFRFQKELGLEVERLSSSECRRLEPGLAPRVRGGILVADDHQVDPQALVTALRTACEKADVSFVREACTSVISKDGRVSGVAYEDSTIPADVVVIAAGSASPGIEGIARTTVPVRPVKGQLVHLRALDPVPVPVSRNVRGLDVYMVPRPDGTLVIGATVEERPDMTVTGGGVHDLMRFAFELVPGVTELEFRGAFAGLRPGTPDNAPLIGPAGQEGLFIATGHYRNGVLLAPATADAFGSWLGDRRVPATIAAFDPARFGSQG